MKKGLALKPLSICVTAVLLTVCLAAHARCQEEEIGVVDMTKVIDLSKQGKKAMDEMAAKLKGAKKDLEKRESEIISLKGEIEKDAMTLPAEALAQKERQYQDKFIDYRRKLEEYQHQLSAKNEEINKRMLSLTNDVVDEIGSGRYLLIFEKTASGVLYNVDSIDLTDEVIERLNKK
ncbi:MAG: OmpH family outer membrane protein [Deltaproteobacteria bacterium]|nr:OmpH family outer membrane protein [Candidatus Zymogenaceae bacterium]